MGLFSKQKKQKKLRLVEEINSESIADDFSVVEKKICTDPYMHYAWVSVCIDIIIRNIVGLNLKLRKMERL